MGERGAVEDKCPFCQIIEGKRDAEIVYSDEKVVAFNDIHPHAPVHVLIVPRKHIRSVNDLTGEDAGLVAEMLMGARQIAKKLSIAESGYKLLINVERGAGQVVFHLHLHLLGGWRG